MNKEIEKHLNTFLTKIGYKDIIGDPNLGDLIMQFEKIREDHEEINEEWVEQNKSKFIEGIDY